MLRRERFIPAAFIVLHSLAPRSRRRAQMKAKSLFPSHDPLLIISHPLRIPLLFFHSRSATRASSSRRPTETADTAASSRGCICITHPDWGTRRACLTWCMSTTWRAFGKRWSLPRLPPSCSLFLVSSLTHTCLLWSWTGREPPLP